MICSTFSPDLHFLALRQPEMDKYPHGYVGIAKNVIMYSKKRYTMVSASCYWLSEKSYLGDSKSCDTGRTRHVNWLRLRDNCSLKELRVLNTHLDHVTHTAREKQADLILEESSQYLAEFPQIVAGDINADSENKAIKTIMNRGWTDTWISIHGDKDPGFTGHGSLGMKKPQKSAGMIKSISSFAAAGSPTERLKLS